MIAGIAMLIGIPFFAAVSGMTWNNLSSDRGMVEFHNVNELTGYNVGVVNGTANQVFLEKNSIYPKTYSSIEELYQAVIDGEIDLAVHDEVSVIHFADENLEDVIVVGPRMYRQNYAWFLPLGKSERKKELEIALLRTAEM